MYRTVGALARSTHPGPSVAVTVIAVILGLGAGLPLWRVVILGLAVLLNQASIGLSNDWIDSDRDRDAGRMDKPVALGLVTPATVRTAAVGAAALAICLTLPLGWPATLAHAVFIASAWAYNAGLKSTAFSVLPYIVSFGLLPLIVTLSLPEPAIASIWAILTGALLGVAAHFANVLPDLDDDRRTGVRGLPHRLGPTASGFVIAVTLGGASASIVLGPGPAQFYQYIGLAMSVALAIGCAVLVLRMRSSRLIFRLIIAAAILDVVLLALSGSRFVSR